MTRRNRTVGGIMAKEVQTGRRIRARREAIKNGNIEETTNTGAAINRRGKGKQSQEEPKKMRERQRSRSESSHKTQETDEEIQMGEE